MKSLALDSSGDLLIVNNSFQMVDGKELLRQKIQEVLGTNRKEWFFDWEQGIDFSNFLGKQVEEEAIRQDIKNGLQQVSGDLVLSNFSMLQQDRNLIVTIEILDESTGEKVDLSKTY